MSEDDAGVVVVLVMLSPIWIGLIAHPLLIWGPPWRKRERDADDNERGFL